MHQFLVSLLVLLLMQRVSVSSLGQVSSGDRSSGRPTQQPLPSPRLMQAQHSSERSWRWAGAHCPAPALLCSAQRLLQPHCCAASTALPASPHLGAYVLLSTVTAGGRAPRYCLQYVYAPTSTSTS